VIRLVRLKREGALGRGDLVAMRRLGTCEVVSIESAHALTVRALDNHTHYRISGIDFGTGTRLSEV
jgi:urease accessory protein UreE